MNVLVLRNEKDEITLIQPFTGIKRWNDTAVQFDNNCSFITYATFETAEEVQELMTRVYEKYVSDNKEECLEDLVVEIQTYRKPDRIRKHMTCPKYVKPKQTFFAIPLDQQKTLQTITKI